MQWYPNAEAMIWFAREVWPRIREAVPSVEMDLIGRHPPREVTKLASEDPAFRVRGFVDDVRPFIDGASVYVVPIRVGGGTRLKILDAMAMGKAIVSHSIGAEGLELTRGRDILIADDAQDFATHVVDLLRNRERCLALGEAARNTVLQQYDWSLIVSSLTGMYESVAKPLQSSEA
jgi:glycosyltransferase involved in cell wall biosynthesis